MSKQNEFIKIENEFISATFASYGCALVSLIYKPLNRECVCGFLNSQDLKKQSFYLGACVGRVANRIYKGQFELNNKSYQLDINNGINHLHGGKYGFNEQIFNFELLNPSTLKATLKDLEKEYSYPGDITFEVILSCIDHSLKIEMSATSSQDTLFDPTLHTYFNLNEDKSQTIKNHKIKLNNEVFYGLDESGCTQSQKIKTTELFNPNELTQIESILNQEHKQLSLAKGIDHFYRKKDEDDSYFGSCCVDDICLEVETSHIGAHIYSGNYLESNTDVSAPFLQENGGICFETHHIPNSINTDYDHAPLLKANETYSSYTLYTFEGDKL